MLREQINTNVFLGVNEVVFGSSNQRLAVVYYPGKTTDATTTIETVGLSISNDCSIVIDHLPREGYQISSYEPNQYGKNFLVFRHGVYSFEEAMFLDEKHVYDVLFLETGEVFKAKVLVVPSGVGRKFKLEFDKQMVDRADEFYSRDAYGSKFVVAK